MFSIIMPTYNVEKYVKQSIESILNQTYKDFELILIDDGSTDNTIKICEEIEKQDKRVAFVKLQHGGVSNARNYGIKKAKGDYILFIDSDDTWDEKLLQICFDNLEEDSLFMFGIRLDYYLNGEFKYSSTRFENQDSGEIIKKDLKEDLEYFYKTFDMLSPCNKVYSAKILKDNDILFSLKSSHEDTEFNFRYCYYIKTIKFICKSLYFYKNYLGEKRFKKRKYEFLYTTGDADYNSANDLTNKLFGKNCEDIELINAIVMKSYIFEALSRITDGKKQGKEGLKALFKNKNFNALLSKAKGKYNRILKICVKLKAYSVCAMLIKKRIKNY